MHRANVGAGYVVRRNFRIKVNPKFDFRQTCTVETDHDLEELKVVHVRDISERNISVDMAFFLSVDWTNVQEMMRNINQAGLRLAVLPEVDCLRSFKKTGQLDCLFRLADDHARARKLRDYVDTLCLPTFGTHIVDTAGEEHIAVMKLCRTCGSDKIELFHRKEVESFHPAWFVPLVAVA